LGGFDEGLDPVSVLEDVDLCLKFAHDGLKTVFLFSPHLFHFEGTTYNTSAMAGQKKDFFVRNSRILRAKWGALLPKLPLSSTEDLRYCLVQKDYTSLAEPRIRVRRDVDGSFADPTDGAWGP
jgi:GT2 family glycosyltransferase